ncbi:MAG: Ribosomal RNA small subunit methyltransferase D [Alphaproteobacteria bacterium ADurb.Bin438]|nr:MAG: Ribosomal RNA small subunit methyltransferase D [Alphaproteobacteria bacterium ADurb.Bin438]
MKVITGKFKGRIIKAPLGMNTRPTKQRIKESIFNILENQFNFKDKVIADVFAGSGGFALEALSRGAKMAYLFEKDYNAIKAINENFKNIEDYKIIKDATKHNVSEVFDLLYFDPPYEKDLLNLSIPLFTKNKLIHDNSIIITETSIDEVTEFQGLVKTDTRVYGKTKIDFFKKE